MKELILICYKNNSSLCYSCRRYSLRGRCQVLYIFEEKSTVEVDHPETRISK